MRAEPPPRVVVDTNVWISAALSPSGTAAAAVRVVLGQLQPVLSPATFSELRTRIWKPKFDRYLSLEQRHRLLHDLEACAHWVEPDAALEAQSCCHDPDDDAFIRCALAASAPWLLTGDDDLLALAGTPPWATALTICTPAQALAHPGFQRPG